MSDKNGPMGRPDLKPCPRQCTVWPNANKTNAMNMTLNSTHCAQIHLAFPLRISYLPTSNGKCLE